MSRTLAYLINQYPKPSHTFIRREIAAVEACGLTVARVSIRPTREPLADPLDRAELARTRALLDVGMTELAAALKRMVRARPHKFSDALRAAMEMGWRSQRGTARHLAYLAEACVLNEWLAQENIHHIHAHFGTNSAAVARLCARLGDVSYSLSVHGPEEFVNAARLSLGAKVAEAAFVVTENEYGRAQLARWCAPRDHHKLRVIHPMLDETFAAGERRPIPLAPRLTCVARLTRAKGQLILLSSIGELKRRGVAAELTLVGDGPLRGEIEQTIAQDGLGSHVRLTGWLGSADVRQSLLNARAEVLPSIAENLPSALLEAMALHRPVVSTAVAGIPELVESGVHGWLVPPGSIAPLTDALENVLTASPARLTVMGDAAAQRVRHAFDARIEGEKMAQLFSAAHV